MAALEVTCEACAEKQVCFPPDDYVGGLGWECGFCGKKHEGQYLDRGALVAPPEDFLAGLTEVTHGEYVLGDRDTGVANNPPEKGNS